jgi:hypothetical protein
MRSGDAHLVNNNEPHPCFLVNTDSKGDKTVQNHCFTQVLILEDLGGNRILRAKGAK